MSLYLMKADKREKNGREFVVVELMNEKGRRRTFFQGVKQFENSGFSDDLVSPTISKLKPVSVQFDELGEYIEQITEE